MEIPPLPLPCIMILSIVQSANRSLLLQTFTLPSTFRRQNHNRSLNLTFLHWDFIGGVVDGNECEPNNEVLRVSAFLQVVDFHTVLCTDPVLCAAHLVCPVQIVPNPWQTSSSVPDQQAACFSSQYILAWNPANGSDCLLRDSLLVSWSKFYFEYVTQRKKKQNNKIRLQVEMIEWNNLNERNLLMIEINKSFNILKQASNAVEP